MLKKLLCVALLVSMTQAGSVVNLLKELLEEQDIEEVEDRGVYQLTKTSNSISGTIQVDVNDCPDPSSGCSYVVKCINTANSNDVQTITKMTASSPVTFSCVGLSSGATYRVEACMDVNGQKKCGPRTARCNLGSSNPCDYQFVKRELEDRGVMDMKADGSSISGVVQIDTSSCPMPYKCSYTVTCVGPTTKTISVETNPDRPVSFSCSGLQAGTYSVKACKDGNSSMCGPRTATCTVGSQGSCSYAFAKKSTEDKNAVIDQIESLLENIRQ